MHNDGQDWQPCPEGELGRMTVRLRRERHFRVVRRASTAAVVLLAAVGATTWYAIPPDEPVQKPLPVTPVTRISCQEVHDEIPALLAGQLPAERAAALRLHLKRCPPCQHYAEKLMAEQQISRDEVFGPFEVVDVLDFNAALAYGYAQP